MIECLRDAQGNITAVCEYLRMDDAGALDDNGRNLIVCEVEVNEAYRNNGALKHFVKVIMAKNKDADRCAWVREHKYAGRKPRLYTREQFKKLIGE